MLEDFPSVVLHGEAQPTHIAGGRLDLTFLVNGDGQDVQTTSVLELLSDHWAQESSLQVARQDNTAPTNNKKWNTGKADWKVFTGLLNSWFAEYNVPESVNQFANDLTSAIHAAADASMPTHGRKKINRNKKHLWYYDDRINFLTRTTRRLTKIYQSSNNEEDRTNLREWVTYARKQINTIREEKWLKHMERLSHTSSMTQVWKHINRVRGKHSRPPAHPHPERKAEELIREYHERSTSVGLPEQLRVRKAALDPARLAAITTATSLLHDTDHPITKEELLRARRTSKDTAPGEDGITYSMLNNVCNVAGDPLLHLFNMSLAQGVLPETWTTANIVPIPKPNEPDKFRLISLTSTMCKMLERILLHRLHYKIGKLHPGVNGFIQHRSTANCLANYASNTKAKTSVFIDIEKAFDRAQRLSS